MDQADDELRETIKHIWPLQAKNMIDLLIPRTDELNNGKMTVGKIYGGLLILESWRSTRFGQIESSGLPVSLFNYLQPVHMYTYYDNIAIEAVTTRVGKLYSLYTHLYTHAVLLKQFMMVEICYVALMVRYPRR